MIDGKLSKREQEVIDLIDQGLNRHEIAEQLGISSQSVRNKIKRLCEEFDCTSRELPEKVRT